MNDPLMKYFKYEHLPPKLQETSRPFAELAVKLLHSLPDNEQRHFALFRLLESKDCAVRAALP